MTDRRADLIEEQLAHLLRAVEDLSEVLRAQGERVDRMERQLALLLEREAAREAEAGASVTLTDERPPHW